MTLLVTPVVIGILGLVATSNPLSAQWVSWLGGGRTFPVGDYGDYANDGGLLFGGVGHSIGDSGLNIGAEVFYGRNEHSAQRNALDNTNLYGVMGGLRYDFARPDADSFPYVFGQLGILRHKYNSYFDPRWTDSGLGLGGGAGYSFPFPRVEVRVMHASIDGATTSFFGIMVSSIIASW